MYIYDFAHYIPNIVRLVSRGVNLALFWLDSLFEASFSWWFISCIRMEIAGDPIPGQTISSH